MSNQATPALFSTPPFRIFGLAAGGLAIVFAVPLWWRRREVPYNKKE